MFKKTHKTKQNSGWALVNGGVVILHIWVIDETIHGLYIRPSQFQRSVKYIIPKRILDVCLHINITIMHIWGVDGGGVGVCRHFPLHMVASLSRLLSLSSLLKVAHVLPVQNVNIFLPIFYPLLPIFSPPLIPLSFPVRPSYLLQTRKIINYVFHIAYMTSHICWYTFYLLTLALIEVRPALTLATLLLLTKQKVFICYVYIPFDKIFLSIPYIYALTSA